MGKHNPIFYERLVYIVHQTGKSMNHIERELGYPRNSLHNYKNGNEPSASRLIEISHYFDVRPEYLIGMGEQKHASTPQTYFDNLNDKQKLEMLDISESWVRNQLSTLLFLEPHISQKENSNISN